MTSIETLRKGPAHKRKLHTHTRSGVIVDPDLAETDLEIFYLYMTEL